MAFADDLQPQSAAIVSAVGVGRRRFRIINEIAEGGFGKVYLAEQMSSDGFSRIVAVKLLHAKWSSHEEVVMRTRDEARLLGLIRHQHIVKVEDLTSIDGKCAIVMEYLEGVDLKWMINFLKDREEEFPRAALFEIILAVSSALDAAYNGTQLQGGNPLQVIHRDIKPSNIFATTVGNVKVLDFGTARANFAEREAKTQALAFGSQGYMAPERMLGEEDTPAADIFSLGITLYELLTLQSFGRIPPRPSKFATKVEERIGSLALEGSDGWSSQIRETLRLMLSYQPDERPTASQLVEIMELLSHDASDMGMRRFSRTLVADAKKALPELDTGDPLTGTIVDEDASTSFPLGRDTSGPQPQEAPPVSPPTPPPVPMGLASLSSMQTPPSAPPYSQTPGPFAESDSLPVSGAGDGTPLHVDSPPSSGGGKMGLIVVGVMLVCFVGVVALGGAGAGAFFMFSGEEQSVVVPAPPPPPDVGSDTPSLEVATADGWTVTSPDSRSDAATIATVLQYSNSEGGNIIIKGPSGFAAKWDGKSTWDMGPLGDGRYSTTIQPEGGSKIRGKSFTVEAGKGSCDFTFDLGSEDWTGGCS
jgi:serine/threonine protein kinase